MIYIFLSCWYIIGIFLLAYSVKYDITRIKKHLPPFLFGGIFGPLIIILIWVDNSTDKDS